VENAPSVTAGFIKLPLAFPIERKKERRRGASSLGFWGERRKRG